MTNIRYILIFGFVYLFGSCSINKGFEALNEYNYFEAKKKFYKSIKSNSSPASYGLSIIYLRNDNPFHDMDSAYHYSLLSVESYNLAKEKKHRAWDKKLDYKLHNAVAQRNRIAQIGFEEAEQTNTPESYNLFMKKYSWSKLVKEANERRDSLAYLLAQSKGTSGAMIEYMEKYPKSKWLKQSQEALYERQYSETTKDGTLKSYLEFVERFPDNPYIRDAQYHIFIEETSSNTISSYDKFIRRYPSSPFLNEAWMKLYRLSISDYQKVNIEQFQKKYPNFPFQDLIKQDLKLIRENLYVITVNGKFGFMDDKGKIKIAPNYDYVESFKDGLAVALKGDKYGYIDKNGEVQIVFQFDEAYDFNTGRAIVVKDDLYGLIDVLGNYILEPLYDDIGSYSEGLVYTEGEDGFQYHTLDGSVSFSGIYKEAYSFQNGIAKVRTTNEIKYIGKDGIEIVSIRKDAGDLHHFNDTLFIYENRNQSDLIGPNGSVLEGEVDKIGALIENRAIVEADGYYGFLNERGNLVISIEYEVYPNYLQFGVFKNGHAVIYRNGKYGMIDSIGRRIMPAIFSGIGTYGELIPVTKGNKWGYSNDKVSLKIPYKYDYAYEFIDGLAIVVMDGKEGMINSSDKIIVPTKFESILRLKDNLFLMKDIRGYGLYKKGVELLPCEYQRIEEVSEGFFRLVKDGNISYFDASKKQQIKLKQ